jgi:predicted DNA-binding protein (MmcQ/YjbR family)
MNAERAREFLLSLPHVLETPQWGGIVFWVGDKAIGGKMFVMLNPDPGEGLPISYPAGQERFNELLELEGLRPAPYMARIFWVAAERWDVFRDREWQEQLTAAHEITYAKLPPKTRSILAMTKAEQKKIIAERRKVLAAKVVTKKPTKT